MNASSRGEGEDGTGYEPLLVNPQDSPQQLQVQMPVDRPSQLGTGALGREGCSGRPSTGFLKQEVEFLAAMLKRRAISSPPNLTLTVTAAPSGPRHPMGGLTPRRVNLAHKGVLAHGEQPIPFAVQNRLGPTSTNMLTTGQWKGCGVDSIPSHPERTLWRFFGLFWRFFSDQS